jgi:hypothetical protein
MPPDRLYCHTCATSPLHYLSPDPRALKRGIAVVGTSVFFFARQCDHQNTGLFCKEKDCIGWFFSGVK